MKVCEELSAAAESKKVVGHIQIENMEQTGKALVVVGLGIAAVGVLVWLGVFRWLRLGRLPGDIVIEKPGFSFFFPITTMILISLAAMLVSWLVAYLRR